VRKLNKHHGTRPLLGFLTAAVTNRGCLAGWIPMSFDRALRDEELRLVVAARLSQTLDRSTGPGPGSSARDVTRVVVAESARALAVAVEDFLDLLAVPAG
jgi:hypothetical protein